MNGLSGFALAGYLNDLDREKKRKEEEKRQAYSAVRSLESDMKRSQDIGDAQSRTQSWLSSLSPEDLQKLQSSRSADFSLPKNDFDFDKSARDIKLRYGDVAGVEDYFKDLENVRVKDSIADATKGMQREKQFADLQALEEKAGIPKGDYNIRSNRQVAIDAGIPMLSGRPEAKEFMDTYVEGPEKDVGKVSTSKDPNELQFGNRAGLVSWFNRPEKVKETLEQLAAFKDKFKMDEDTYNMWVKKAQQGESYDAREYMTKEMESRLKNKYTIEKEYGLLDPRKLTAGATTEARGSAEAFTPKFVADRKKEWEKTLADYNEGYQQFALGKAAPDDATGDVALINSLEKVREINSAVMYGDFEKWKKATNFWQSLEQNGLVDAATSKLKARLPEETRNVIKTLLDDLYSNRKSVLVSARDNAMSAAIEDYGWDEQKANRTYRMPDLGYTQGYDEKDGEKKPVVTEPPPKKPNPLDKVDSFAKDEGDAIMKRQEERAKDARSKWGY